MSGITRTQDVTVADAWANDDGGVSLEFEGHIVPVSPEEAIGFAVAVFAAAVDAAEGLDEKADAEMVITELGQRALITHWDPYALDVPVSRAFVRCEFRNDNGEQCLMMNESSGMHGGVHVVPLQKFPNE